MEDVCMFGLASAPAASGEFDTGFVFKIMGRARAGTDEDYQILLEVTNVQESFIATFRLGDVIEALAEESGTKLPADLALGWLKVHFDGEQLAATLSGGDGSGGGGGVQLSAVHREEALELAVTLRLPPRAPAPRVPDAARAAWVAQDVLFSQSERLRALQAKLEACEQRCPPEQQFEDALAFLDGGGGSEASPLRAPCTALVKRKQVEEEALPALGSTAKAARPSGGAGAAGPAAARAQPATTQQTGGASNRTDASDVGQPRRVAGHGRGRAIPGRGGRRRGGRK